MRGYGFGAVADAAMANRCLPPRITMKSPESAGYPFGPAAAVEFFSVNYPWLHVAIIGTWRLAYAN